MPGPPAPPQVPIAELQSLIDSHGDELAKLFAPAPTLFADASAGIKDPKQKLAERGQIILR